MKTFLVEMPVTMNVAMFVKVEDDEDKEEALSKIFGASISVEVRTEEEDIEIAEYEWDFCEQIVEGNVFCGINNRMTIMEYEG